MQREGKGWEAEAETTRARPRREHSERDLVSTTLQVVKVYQYPRMTSEEDLTSRAPLYKNYIPGITVESVGPMCKITGVHYR